MPKKLTTEEFIQRAKQVHGDKYDYSKSIYIDSYTKLKIICSKHGIFEQKPYIHLQGYNCYHCGLIDRDNKHRKNIETFIIESHKIHNNKYDYSMVQYKNNITKIKIICSKHGVFEQTPNSHISQKCGCPKCANVSIPSTQYFIEKSIEIHGNKYDYSKSNYINSRTKICIICKKHGKFCQIASTHLRGCGCPKCQRSKGEEQIANWLKEHNINYKCQFKFKNCKNKNLLSFDFFLPEMNICIEFDGKQHFQPISEFGGLIKFNKQKINDNIKNQYCYIHNIKLIRIPYYDYNNIDIILSLHT
jgi:hypothetical protein